MYEKSYHSRVLKQEDKTAKTRKRKFSWKKTVVVLCILIVVFGVGYAVKYPKFQVSEITVVGASVIDTEDIKQQVRDQLEGRVLWIFPRTSILLVEEKKIADILKKEFSRIETISVRRSSFHGIEITLKEFDALYLWCANTEGDCYFMDKQGVVYSHAPVFSGTAYPKVITGAPLEDLPFKAMDQESVDRIALLEKRLSEINITPAVFRTISGRQMNIDFLHNKTVAELRIDPTVATDTSLEYLFSGIRTDPLASLFHNEQKKLLYIDVRFPSKVVYKFQE